MGRRLHGPGCFGLPLRGILFECQGLEARASLRSARWGRGPLRGREERVGEAGGREKAYGQVVGLCEPGVCVER